MATIQPQGRVVHMTGQVAWDADERIVGPGDLSAQAVQCFRNIDTLLSMIGGRLSDIVELTTYYTAADQLPDIQKVRAMFVDPENPPASTSIMVAGLGHPEFLLELTPIAVIPDHRFQMPEDTGHGA